MAAARPIGSTPSSAPVCAFPPSTALKPIKLTRTAKGWSAFEMLFKAHLGSQLSASLNMAIVNKMMVATDARQAALFKHIFDRLVIALENETDLIESIAENCMALKHFCTSSSSLLGSQSRPASRASAAS